MFGGREVARWLDYFEDVALELFFFDPGDLAGLAVDPPVDSDLFDESEEPELPLSEFAEESVLDSPGFAEPFTESEESEELVPESLDVLVLAEDDRASFL